MMLVSKAQKGKGWDGVGRRIRGVWHRGDSTLQKFVGGSRNVSGSRELPSAK